MFLSIEPHFIINVSRKTNVTSKTFHNEIVLHNEIRDKLTMEE